MYRLKTVSSFFFYAAGILVCFVFTLYFFTPSYQPPDNLGKRADQRLADVRLLARGWFQEEKTTRIYIPADLKEEMTAPPRPCREILITIEQYRARSVIRGVIVRFPSINSEFFFVQFRWFYRSWIESEMFTLDRWRTDLIILIDEQFPSTTRKLLEVLDCRVENQRTSRRQTSRCLLVVHKLLSQRPKSDQQSYIDKYQMLSRLNELDANTDRLFAVYDYANQLNNNQTITYDFLMVTTMNTFLTTQFGKYIPIKCAFLIGAGPDFSTWYGKVDQIIQFSHTLLQTLSEVNGDSTRLQINYVSTRTRLKDTFLFIEKQVDISCDSTITTYRTFVYHLKCYAHSTSLFSEKMFRENAYDGFEKEPFNIYIAREYATLMALQSKVSSLEKLHALAFNVTRREANT